jgi:hypothetical protein
MSSPMYTASGSQRPGFILAVQITTCYYTSILYFTDWKALFYVLFVAGGMEPQGDPRVIQFFYHYSWIQ